MVFATTIEEKRRNARRRNTEDDFALTTEMIAEGVVDVCLACASRTVKKEGLARVSGDCLDNFIKGRSLVWIESVDALCPQLNLLFQIVIPLLCNKRISNNGTPILLNLKHVWPIQKRRAEHFLNEIEAIVKDIFLGGVDTDTAGVERVTEVIAYESLVLIPESGRTGWIAFAEDGDKQQAQLVTGSHHSSFSETLMPLVVICQQTTCQTGLLKGGRGDSSKGSKVRKGCGTLDGSEKESEVEALASLGSDVVHASDCKAPLTWFPCSLFEVVDKGRGKVLVVEVAGGLVLGIGLEVGSKCGVAVACPLDDLLQRVDAILVPCDHLLAWKVDLKADNVGINCMHLVCHQTPKGLALRDIACIQIELDLVLTLAKLHGGAIKALVDILVDVLDASDRANALHVDVALILPEQKDAEGNDCTIIDLHAIG